MRVVQTCGACPEQYDVFEENRLVGYLRLRWGNFRAHFPNVNGSVIYEYTWPNEPLKGMFESQEEREEQLAKALEAIQQMLIGE